MNLLADTTDSSFKPTFALTDAIRPADQVPFVPVQGYRLERFRDPQSRRRIPMLAAAVSSEHLFEIFLDLLIPLGETVQTVLESSHESEGDYHLDLRRGEIDLPVLMSHLCDFEELLLHDGCTGVAVLSEDRPIEVQLDEHKLIYVYAFDLKPFRRIFRSHGVRRRDEMRLIAETEHIHHSKPEQGEEFRQFACRLGAGDFDSVFSDESGRMGW